MKTNRSSPPSTLPKDAAKPRRARPAPQGGRVPHPPSGRAHRSVLYGAVASYGLDMFGRDGSLRERVPGLTRDLSLGCEAPDHVRGAGDTV